MKRKELYVPESLRVIQKILDVLHNMKIISREVWLEAHSTKWGHYGINKPKWVKRKP